jgi:hypothetical protein
MRIISSDEATIDDAFEAAQLMIEDSGHGVQLLRAPEIALVRAGAIDQASYRRVRSEIS